jgi:fumarate hydratase class II
MNTNEVIANRASEILGEKIGSKVVHPNDHVNRGQSSNDVIPSAMHVSLITALKFDLLPNLTILQSSLTKKAKAFDAFVKIGRTHLQDATPIRLGQVFLGYAGQISDSISRIERAIHVLREVALGGTAVGTGLNMPRGFSKDVLAKVSKRLDIDVVEATNHFSAQSAKDAIVEASGALRTTAVAMYRVANDIRWQGSGPRCGFGEITLPETQPGSSIMPGKVNPVIAESVMMICAQVIGNDATVTFSGSQGNFELNVMMPVMAHNVLESSAILSSGAKNLSEKCVQGIEANQDRMAQMIEQSLAMCTSLAPLIGYDEAAAIAKEAFKTGRTVREIAKEKTKLSEADLNKALDAHRMTEPDG